MIGTTLAYELARAGEKVTVADAAAGPALETSFANGSLITPSMSDPWASPGVPKMMLKYLGREDAPFLVRMRSLAAMTGWGLAFLRNCGAERWRRNTCAVFPLAQYSRARLLELARNLSLEFEQSPGFTVLLRTERDIKSARPVLAALRLAFLRLIVIPA